MQKVLKLGNPVSSRTLVKLSHSLYPRKVCPSIVA